LTSTTGGGAGSFSVLQIIDTGAVDQPSLAVDAGSVWVTWNDGGTIQARGAAVTGLGTVGAFNAERQRLALLAEWTVRDIAIGLGQVMVTSGTTTRADTNANTFAVGIPASAEYCSIFKYRCRWLAACRARR
jgi:hypothetical protein